MAEVKRRKQNRNGEIGTVPFNTRLSPDLKKWIQERSQFLGLSSAAYAERVFAATRAEVEAAEGRNPR